MDKYIFQNKSKAERIQILKDNAYKITEETYWKKYSEEELNEKKDLYSEKAIELNKLESDLKAVKDEYTREMKPLKSEMGGILTSIKMRAEEVEEICYQLVDYDEGMMGTYNADGELIFQKPLTREQRQLTLNLKQA